MNSILQYEYTKLTASRLAGKDISMPYYDERLREHRFDPDLEKRYSLWPRKDHPMDPEK